MSGAAAGAKVDSFMSHFADLGPKGITFLVINVILIVIMIFDFIPPPLIGFHFGVVLGLLLLILIVIGFYSSYKKDLRGLLIYFYLALVISAGSVVNVFILLLAYVSPDWPGYVGAIGGALLTGINAYLAFDGRGRSFSWNVPR